MTKRAIYLDDRERELARRALEYVVVRLREATRRNVYDIQNLATKWTTVEILALLQKLEEPEEEIPPS